MRGRAHLSTDVSEIKIVFSIPPHRPTPNFPPSWNVAPTDPLQVARCAQKPASAASTSCVGARCRIGRRTSKSGLRISTRWLKPWITSWRFEKHSKGAAVSFRWTAFMSGRKPPTPGARCDRAGRPTSGGLDRPMGELALTGGRMRSQLRDHQRDPTSCAARSTIACR